MRRGGGCCRCGQTPEQHQLGAPLVALTGRLLSPSGLFYAYNGSYTQINLIFSIYLRITG